MAEESVKEKEQQFEGEDTVNEPGRTPGQAEGEDVGDDSYDPAADPGRTPGQAEGSEDSLEGRDLDEESTAPNKADQKGKNAQPAAPRQAQPGQQKQQRTTQQQQATAAQQRAKASHWEERVNVEEVIRWSALIGGGWLALYGLRHSLGSLTLIGIGGGLLYYALNGKWPATNQRARPATETAMPSAETMAM